MVTTVSSTTNTGTSNATATDASKLTNNYETFLSLLTAQIKNQDPLSPMDTTEWTNQLVQYSSVEQSIKSNSYLQKIADASGESIASAANYIGKTVSADQAQANLSNGKASWDYSLDTNATDVTLTLTNANGVVVYSQDTTDNTAGSHSFTWDGKGSNGQTLTDGQYTLSVSAKDASGSAVATSVSVKGTVSSVQMTDSGIELLLDKTPVMLSAVKSVS